MKIYKRYYDFIRALPIQQLGTRNNERLYEFSPLTKIWQEYPEVRGFVFSEATLRTAFQKQFQTSGYDEDKK